MHIDIAESQVSRVVDETRQLVALSTPSGEQAQTEAAMALCAGFLPGGASVQRVASATDGCVADLIAKMAGHGRARLLLLGHLDTVFSHAEHRPPHVDGQRLYGSGVIDMKGGVAFALALARLLDPVGYAEMSLLLVTDEEWRTAPFAHSDRFGGYDACLCFEAGEADAHGINGVVVQRKGAGTLRVLASGRAAHSGVAPESGRNALLALADVAIRGAALSEPNGDDLLTVVPTVLNAGGASNVVPAGGELVFDIRAAHTEAFARVRDSVPQELDGVRLQAVLDRVWPAMNSRHAAEPVLARAAAQLGRPVVGRSRGGASDASHFAGQIPITIDGLGPRGAGAHTPEEHLDLGSLQDRLAVALAVAEAVILGVDHG
ncbi:MAG: M20/M25/M40 family metallo-hydrolase [Solirubrobacteraceae bacterium]